MGKWKNFKTSGADHYASAYTKEMCEKDAKKIYAGKQMKCDVDWTDPANAKCYHDAQKAGDAKMRECKRLPTENQVFQCSTLGKCPK